MADFFTDSNGVTTTGLPRFRDLLEGLSGEERELAREALFPDETDPGPLRVAETAEQVPFLEPFPAELVDVPSPLEEQNRFFSGVDDLVRTPPGGFITRSGVQVSGPIQHGPDPFIINNPFTDESLTPEQQKEAVQQITDIQESARKQKRERLEAAFRSKWRAVQRVKADPSVPVEQKQQLDFQIQAELREMDKPDIIDLFDVEKGKDSPEVLLAQIKRQTRKMLDSRYGDSGLSESVTSLITLDRDGNPNFRNALPLIAMREEEETQKRREKLRVENDREAMLIKMKDAAVVAGRFKGEPSLVAVFDGLVREYERKFGRLSTSAPDRSKAGFNAKAEIDRIFGDSLLPAATTPITTPNNVIQLRTQMDIEKFKSDVMRRRRGGEPNYRASAQGPDGIIRWYP